MTWLRLFLHRLLRRTLTVRDLRVTPSAAIELTTATVLFRAGLFEACEVVRLCEAVDGSGRRAVERLRDQLMALTKADHNLLPHEQTKTKKTQLPKKDLSPLLPRYDLY